MGEKPAERPIEDEDRREQEESVDTEGRKGGKKGAGPVCYICGKTALRTCERCKNRICASHYDPSAGLCTQCKSKRGTSQECYVCFNPAGHRCRSCGKMVCGNHYDPNQGLCVMCKIHEHRESLRYSGGKE